MSRFLTLIYFSMRGPFFNISKLPFTMLAVMQALTYTYFVEDITRWHEDITFIFEWQNNILRTNAASE